MSKRLAAVTLAAALLGGATPNAVAANLSKREARDFLVRAFPGLAPRALLRDQRAGFFSTQSLRVEPARRCHRDDATSVTCRFRARLVPDATHRKRNWWPISCQGQVRAQRLRNGQLRATPRDYVCRTIRPSSR